MVGMLDPHSRAASFWLVVGLVSLSGSAMVVSPRALLLVGAALVILALTWTFYSRLQGTVAAITRSREHGRVVSTVRARASLESSGSDVYEWENEGGARRPA